MHGDDLDMLRTQAGFEAVPSRQNRATGPAAAAVAVRLARWKHNFSVAQSTPRRHP